MKSFTQQQENLALAYVSYAGADLKKADAGTLYSLLNDSLQQSAALSGKFTVVWGPACYRSLTERFDQNLMFVVQGGGDYRVVIRGTDPSSVYDWIFEDIWVAPAVSWSTFDPSAPAAACIAPGVKVGLSNLLEMKVESGLPGAGLGLIDYLNSLANAGRPVALTVTGHSSGAALASTLGLLLADTLDSVTFKLAVQTFAGETAGNQAFASYLEQRLGAAVLRVYNTLDIVPHAWQESDLQQIPSLYEPLITPPGYIKLLVDAFIKVSKSIGYQQFSPAQALTGVLDENYPHFMKQVVYQHFDAYPPLMAMADGDIVIVNGITISSRYGVAKPMG